MQRGSPTDSSHSLAVSRSRVHFWLLLAAISYWTLWFAPLFVSIGFGYFFFELWGVSTASAAKWGAWWVLALCFTLSPWLTGGFYFLLLSIRIPYIWASGIKSAATPAGIPLAEGEAPELFVFIEGVRRRTSLNRPVEVWVDASPAVGNLVYRVPGCAEFRRALVIGLPAVAVLSGTDLELLLTFNLGILNLSHRLLTRVGSLLSFAQRFPPSAQAGPYYMGSRGNYFRCTAELCRKAQKMAGEYATGFASIDGRDARLALQTLQKIGMGFQKFWLEHGQMMLQSGHMVPIFEGFRAYWGACFPDESAPTSAASVFRSASAIEARLTREFLRLNPNVDSISWDQAATVLLAGWNEYIKPKISFIRGLRVQDLHDLDLLEFGRGAFHRPGRLYHPNQLRLMGAHLLATALAVALSREGWRFTYYGPASPMAFCARGKTVEPFTLFSSILDRSLDRTAWMEMCMNKGIADLVLGS